MSIQIIIFFYLSLFKFMFVGKLEKSSLLYTIHRRKDIADQVPRTL